MYIERKSAVYDEYGALVRADYAVTLWRDTELVKREVISLTNGTGRKRWILEQLREVCRQLEKTEKSTCQKRYPLATVFTDYEMI